jgi:hypothetical protein
VLGLWWLDQSKLVGFGFVFYLKCRQQLSGEMDLLSVAVGSHFGDLAAKRKRELKCCPWKLASLVCPCWSSKGEEDEAGGSQI